MSNRDYRREVATAARKRVALKAAAIVYLGGQCIVCGFDDLNRPEVFDFDHLPGTIKSWNIANLINKKGWDALEVELKKCELICSNCHRTRTKERGYRSTRGNKTENS